MTAIIEHEALRRPERFTQRGRDGRDALQLTRRQVVEVLVHRLARMDLVLDPVEAGHEQRREGEDEPADRPGQRRS